MNNFRFRLILSVILLSCFAHTLTAHPFPWAMSAPSEASGTLRANKESLSDVGYSFDYLADNSKVARLYVSKDMLASAHASGLLKSSQWDFSKVVGNATGLLVLHTHSQSTTTRIRNDYRAVLKDKHYEMVYQIRSQNTEIMVFGIRNKQNGFKELLFFRFRDSYCSRVVQITGNFTSKDIATVIKKHP